MHVLLQGNGRLEQVVPDIPLEVCNLGFAKVSTNPC